MISDQERREVAEQLRCLASAELTPADIVSIVGTASLNCQALAIALLGAVGFVTDDPSISQIIGHLADLIDRPTCCIRPDVEDEGTIWDLFGTCTCCGAIVDAYSATATASGFLPTRYCPACGAKVVG